MQLSDKSFFFAKLEKRVLIFSRVNKTQTILKFQNNGVVEFTFEHKTIGAYAHSKAATIFLKWQFARNMAFMSVI